MSAPVHGILAEFRGPEQLLAAAKAAYGAGYRRMDGFSPYAVEGLAEAIGFRTTRVPLIMLLAGISGALIAYSMQWYSAVWDYPLNVGGRPLHSWPAFVPITFELSVLFAAVAGVIGMLALNGLPRPYHPVFNVPAFRLASQTRFFLYIESADPRFRAKEVRDFLFTLAPAEVTEVPA